MTSATPDRDFATVPRSPGRPAETATVTTRDLRLDVARGIAMFIILIAHIPYDPWANWIPARFGFSDATEIFVFCSGMASAIAFGGAFLNRGWAMGTARTAYRLWQVYWAHIGLFFFVAMSMAAIDLYANFDKSYVDALNLQHFFEAPEKNIVALFTLTYVPNYFDILPMYLGVLALMPVLMFIVMRVGVAAAMATSVAIWLAANFGMFPLPAEPWSDRQWFFNPFAWQLLFFTGFAFMRGWLPAPRISAGLIWLSIAFLILGAPFGAWKVFLWVEAGHQGLGDWIRSTYPLTAELRDKTEFGLLRYLHFLAIAYLAYAAVGDGGHRLHATGDGFGARIWRWLMVQIVKVGQQSLAVFVFSMAIAQLIGMTFDQLGRSFAVVTAGNLIGFGLLIGVAYLASWFKSQPWRGRKA
ncbi:OpgC family protein [Chachezhania antarctica]|uniref:OpgC family protein n=1 Tax=Chachezhania antarctica TaxID=2340860 RepID=UPI000EB4730C|nr:OpgC domain-containing protein [Chachezhania antarctica]